MSIYHKVDRRKHKGTQRLFGQPPINIFIADFYCHAIKLVVEVDGKIHNKEENKDNDLNRTAELESYGITVIRFSNDEVLEDIEEVRNKIELECKRLLKA